VLIVGKYWLYSMGDKQMAGSSEPGSGPTGSSGQPNFNWNEAYQEAYKAFLRHVKDWWDKVDIDAIELPAQGGTPPAGMRTSASDTCWAAAHAALGRHDTCWAGLPPMLHMPCWCIPPALSCWAGKPGSDTCWGGTAPLCWSNIATSDTCWGGVKFADTCWMAHPGMTGMPCWGGP